MSGLKLLGFVTLDCGCLVGRYSHPAINAHVDYIEEKGRRCTNEQHQDDQVVPQPVEHRPTATRIPVVAQAS